ncbi:hypothetical protein [Streptomyces sp. CBMA29]|uniref:hypothetical protein n=1 Tax=Streptomyces sp. CBMA29 TaxID=1896314 RepID=UPI001661CD99|nr:hypothetical protein [Streptomyces sp. CBMA29]MBD0733987.1 hypothetical protein [Streptomyces sp. CBMA29]
MGTMIWPDNLTDEALAECLSENRIPEDFTLEHPGPHEPAVAVTYLVAEAWDAGLNGHALITELLAYQDDGDVFIVVQMRSGIRLVNEGEGVTEWAEKHRIEPWEPSGVELARKLLQAVRAEADKLVTTYLAELDKARTTV